MVEYYIEIRMNKSTSTGTGESHRYNVESKK